MAEEGGWFHCGRCGHLFRGVVGQSCPECDGHPVVEEKELAFLEAANQFRKDGGTAPAPMSPTSPKRRKARKGGLLKFVIGWITFLGALVVLVAFLRSNEGSDNGSGTSVADAGEEARIVRDDFAKCTGKMREFLNETIMERRVKVVHDPAETLRKMVRFGRETLKLEHEEAVRFDHFQPLDVDGVRGYEGLVELVSGQRVEFVFLPNEEKELGIDWSNLVRYSDHPWPLFLSGDSPSTGEFRLLARRRAGSSGELGDVTSIVLFAPDPWDPERLGPRSPEVQVDRGSEVALMLEQAFADRGEGEGPFGSRLQESDPRSMVRVHVKLRRHEPAEVGDAARIEIENLLACHWLSVSHPGVEVIDE